MSESIQPGLINLGRSKFEFDSAHVKYGVLTGPKTENISFYAFHKVDLFSLAFALRFEFNRGSHFPQFLASARNSLVLVCKLRCVNCFVFVCCCFFLARTLTYHKTKLLFELHQTVLALNWVSSDDCE